MAVRLRIRIRVKGKVEETIALLTAATKHQHHNY